MKYDFIKKHFDLDPQTSAAISSSIDTLSGYAAASNTNRKERRFIQQMYHQQQADNIRNWQMQNAYNSPKAQMERLKQAGLNPNLVYGHGADAQGGQINSTSAGSWHPNVPPTDFGSKLAVQMGIQMNKLQMENLKAQNQYIQAQTMNVDTDTRLKAVGHDLKSFDLDFKKDTRDVALQIKQAGLDKILNEISFTANEDLRRAAMNGAKMDQIVEQILNSQQMRQKFRPQQMELIKEQIQYLQQSGRLRKWDEWLNKQGLQRGDPLWFRKLTEIFSREIGNPTDFDSSTP